MGPKRTHSISVGPNKYKSTAVGPKRTHSISVVIRARPWDPKGPTVSVLAPINIRIRLWDPLDPQCEYWPYKKKRYQRDDVSQRSPRPAARRIRGIRAVGSGMRAKYQTSNPLQARARSRGQHPLRSKHRDSPPRHPGRPPQPTPAPPFLPCSPTPATPFPPCSATPA